MNLDSRTPNATRGFIALACVAAMTASACTSEKSVSQPSRQPTTTSEKSTRPSDDCQEEEVPPRRPIAEPFEAETAYIHLTLIAKLDRAVAMATHQSGAIFVGEQDGRIWILRDDLEPELALDLSSETVAGKESGFLGLVLNPAGNRIYVDYTDDCLNVHVVEYAVTGGNPSDLEIDRSSKRQVLLIEKRNRYHSGGALAFGPDGYLYISVGDGTAYSDGDGDEVVGENAQLLDTLLGKILRIDPTPIGNESYSIPVDNPFIDDTGARPEIWAYGLRNPWRMSFDLVTGDLWITDVGEAEFEEVNLQPAGSAGGLNYGWNRFEGTFLVQGNAGAEVETSDESFNAVTPVFEYTHAYDACAVVGGYAYRGSLISELSGKYIFADFCTGAIQTLDLDGGEVLEATDLEVTLPLLTSFGQGLDGELYAMAQGLGLYRIDPSE